ncbi:HNH endonuclease signature motif containing protein [Streptomyces sp. NBC_00425]|uniref:HNH endonuclease signature motif containing protein n=1 Tax=Streptomyces sp. NBC_00425 TaxID=2975740 RepID=UPI002E23EEE2
MTTQPTYQVDQLPEHLRSQVRVTDAGCWEWQGKVNNKGYGYYSERGRHTYAHRSSYEALVGPIPDGLEIDHLCVNPPCINPADLEPVTHAENQRRIAERQTACKRQGHDWTDPANVRTRPNGSRYCYACEREAQRRRHTEKTGVPYRGAQADRTHCPQGHPYDEENTYRTKRGGRMCKECTRQRNRERRALKRL